MATQETQELDSIISSRRALLLGGSALAALAMTPKMARAANTVSTYTDADILNFALNLEYLEANFYYMAAFGTTIDKPTAASAALGGPTATIALNGVATNGNPTAGITATVGTATNVPFVNPTVKAYAIETAIEEGKHVNLLRSALGAAAVAQPPIDVSPLGAFTTLANAATIPSALNFNPYANDLYFLLGAFIFEDVGVTAYHGAAPLITAAANLSAAASILAVEAYHAGLIRTTIGLLDPNNTSSAITATQLIANLRAKLSLQANTAVTVADDYGLAGPGISTVKKTLDGGGSVTVTQIVDADTNVIAFGRNTNQVLNIVTGGGALTAGATAKGVFFPSGLNGLFS